MKNVKFLLLSLSMLFLGIGSSHAQDTFCVEGNIDSLTNGQQIMVTATFYVGSATYTDSALCDSNGYYKVCIITNTPGARQVGWDVSIRDCNGNKVMDRGFIDPTRGKTGRSRNLTYCSRTGGGGGGTRKDTFCIYGMVDSLIGKSIPVKVELAAGTKTFSATGKTTNRGTFNICVPADPTAFLPYKVLVTIQDCNGKDVTATGTVDSRNKNTTVRMVYCNRSGGGGTTCKASFKVTQAMRGRTPVPGQLVVRENSKGPRGSSGLSYAWDFGDGNKSSQRTPKHTYNGNGPYVLCLTITDNANCTDTYCDTVRVDTNGYVYKKAGFTIAVVSDDPVGIDESQTIDATIYPNPATSTTTLQFNTTSQGIATIVILDASGRAIETWSTSVQNGENVMSLPVSNLQNGLYLMQLQTADGVWQQSFIKQ